MSNLVIVESPTKAKTLSKILDKKYKIEASMGHIRDLPKKELGVDIENNFEPLYVIPPKASKTTSKLKKLSKDVETVYLATDPDREGEAIAWHLKYILDNQKGKNTIKEYKRVVFHELTKDAVLKAFDNPSTLNENLVDSQQARRVLDRLVGYKLSPLLWKKVRYGLSAGRVQSVAVRLIVEKERERNAFKPDEYWSVEVDLNAKKDTKKLITAELSKKDSNKVTLTNEADATKVKNDLENDTYEISDIKKSERSKKPSAPYKTSTLQQAMANTYGASANRTMRGAQSLFEEGHITYHRTDSLHLSDQFIKNARAYIKEEYGNKYLPKEAIQYKTMTKGAQEAHEAIRSTNIKINPKSPEITKLDKDAQRVYFLVWKRSLECQMTDAVYDQTRLTIKTSKNYELKASGSVIKFDGWLTVGKSLGESIDKNLHILPEFSISEELKVKEVRADQHFTQPPARYSDASLIKKLEELGIGRPSTYAPTISTIQKRGYVEKEARYFFPKDVAYVVVDLLTKHFPSIIGYEFTAKMEEKFDDIAQGVEKWVPVIKDFYEPFEKTLDAKDKELDKRTVTTLEVTDEKCPECKKGTLVVKLGKYGKFLSCDNFPDCEYAKPLDDNGDEIEQEDYGACPECEDGKFVLKQGRFGKFLACSNYPKCKTTKPYLDKIGMKCPDCGDGEVIVKKAKGRNFFGCSNYPKCKYASWKNPKEQSSEDADGEVIIPTKE